MLRSRALAAGTVWTPEACPRWPSASLADPAPGQHGREGHYTCPPALASHSTREAGPHQPCHLVSGQTRECTRADLGDTAGLGPDPPPPIQRVSSSLRWGRGSGLHPVLTPVPVTHRGARCVCRFSVAAWAGGTEARGLEVGRGQGGDGRDPQGRAQGDRRAWPVNEICPCRRDALCSERCSDLCTLLSE